MSFHLQFRRLARRTTLCFASLFLATGLASTQVSLPDEDVYPDVVQPMEIPRAFGQERDRRAAQSQAALLLIIGNLVSDAEETAPIEDLALADELEELKIPLDLRTLRERYESSYSLEEVTKDLPVDWVAWTDAGSPDIGTLQANLTERLFGQPDPYTAAQLAAISIHHPDSLVQVAAALPNHRLIDDARELPIEILVKELDNESPLVREVAATVLARLEADHQELDRFFDETGSTGRPSPTETSLLVHGTWASNGQWWRPGGPFHTYLLHNVDGSLYSNPEDRFSWSGKWRHGARVDAAQELVKWLKSHDALDADLIAHSHGANVAILASQDNDLDIDCLVLLSCPVWSRYSVDPVSIQHALSIRVRLDLVILADGGGQLFRENVEEHRMHLWFKHAASRRSDNWVEYGFDGLVQGNCR